MLAAALRALLCPSQDAAPFPGDIRSLSGACSDKVPFVFPLRGKPVETFYRTFRLLPLGKCDQTQSAGGLRWTRTTDLTLIRRAL